MASVNTTKPFHYDVFLSFRGEDTRKTFADHLYDNLVARGFRTFRDHEELEIGGDIASELSRAMDESRIFLVIFSKNYATSKWCLNELVKIMECRAQKGSAVFPVFYHVNPTDVGNQKESFEDAFLKHEKDADQEKREMIKTWKIALKKASKLSGYPVDDQFETDVIKEIISDIIRTLNRKPLNMGKNIIGMDSHLDKLKSLTNIELNAVCVVGIYGIGGVGKSTTAKAFYNDISDQFQGSCFLQNVRERSKDNALQLQKELLHGILKGKSLKINNVEEGIQMIKNCLRDRRVLVVLDDVDNVSQLEFLAQEHDWFSVKSMIIITTRDRHVLAQYEVNLSYEIKSLKDDEAIELFSEWAFKQNLPPEAYRDLSYSVIGYAAGLPLALKVLGSFFLDKTIPQWKEGLRKLRKIPNMEIQNILKISYDALDDIDKGIFLDIACFFKGEDKDFVSRLLDNTYAETGISALQNKCLISVSENKLGMHDLVQQMGHEIVRQECPKEPGKWSRLWDPEDIFRVLTRNTGTETIEGIVLDASGSKQIHFTKEAFKMMNRLRLLKVHQDAKYKAITESHMVEEEVQLSKMHLDRDFEIHSYDLTFLHWDAYSLDSLPSNFQADDLVELHLRCSNIKQPWEGNMIFSKLQILDLSFSVHLIKIPDISSMPNLKILILEGCINLGILPSDIYKLKRLQKLSCVGCLKLESFPETKGAMKNLTELYLSNTAIKELPSSLVRHLKALKHLDLRGCGDIIHVPKSIAGLSSLETLRFGFCPRLDKLPDDLGSLPCLQTLGLDSLKCALPCLSGLSSLRRLSLNHCDPIEGVLKDIFGLSSLEKLELKGNHFSSIPADISKLPRLRSLDLSHCEKLLEIPELPSSLRVLDTHGSPATLSDPSTLLKCFKSLYQEKECGNSQNEEDLAAGIMYMSGIRGPPDWLEGCLEGSQVGTDLPQGWYQDEHFLGVAFGCVYSLLDDESCDKSMHVSEDESDSSENDSKDEESQEKSSYISLTCFTIIKSDGHEHDDSETFNLDCECYKDAEDRVSDKFWMMYYPKVSIPKSFCSDRCTTFTVSFELSNHFGKLLKVKKSYIHFIYDNDSESHCSACELDREHKVKLCLAGSDLSELIIESPSDSVLETLCLRNCQNLESLPSELCKLKSLKGLFCSGCSKLKSLPGTMGDMESLIKLYLDGTAIEELPSSIEQLQGLQDLSLQECINLESLPEGISNLRSLTSLWVQRCSELKKLPDNLGHLHNLEELQAANSGSISFQLPSLSGLRSLRILNLLRINLMQGAVLSDICSLHSLTVVDLRHCNIIEGGIPSEICHLSSLQALFLGGNHFRSIPDGINKLSELTFLDLSHCPELLKIAADHLPSSLQILDIHGCTSLETLSNTSTPLPSCLFKCFTSAIQSYKSGVDIPLVSYIPSDSFPGSGLKVLVSDSGNQEWIRYQKEGSNVSRKLPRNWNEDDDLLGFAVCSVHVRTDQESEQDEVEEESEQDGVEEESEQDEVEEEGDTWSFKCGLTIEDGHQFKARVPLSYRTWCNCDEEDDVLGQVWVSYYPKLKFRSMSRNYKRRRVFLTAEFRGSFNGRPTKVEKCGIHLMYAHEQEPSS